MLHFFFIEISIQFICIIFLIIFFNKSALYIAANKGYTSIVKLLLSRDDIDVNSYAI